jgi:hypothetical protein
MAGVSFITHNGVRILYEDFSSLNNTEELLAFIEQAKTIIHQQPEKSVLALVNVKDSKFDNSVSSALKELAKSNEPYMKCAAVYGVEGLKEIIYRAILAFTGRKNLVLFKNLEEAKDFLSKQK